jgi:hypothetical protein
MNDFENIQNMIEFLKAHGQVTYMRLYPGVTAIVGYEIDVSDTGFEEEQLGRKRNQGENS